MDRPASFVVMDRPTVTALLGGDAQNLLDWINPQEAASPGLQGQFVEDGGRGVGFAGFGGLVGSSDRWLALIDVQAVVGQVALVWIRG